MKQMLVIGCIAGLPAGVLAQTPSAARASDRDAEAPRLAATSPYALPDAPGTATQQKPADQPPPPPPPAPPERPRRLGSMVGYNDSAIVESKARIRFDHGMRTAVPDRAEFFYAKCGCYRQLEIRDHADPEVRAIFDPDAPGPGPGIPAHLNFQQLYLEGEYAFTPRLSLFGEFPIRWLQPQAFAPPPAPPGSFPNQGGFSDLRLGARAALVSSAEQAVTAQLRAFLPTGDAGRGLGTDHASLEPALLVYHRPVERLAIEGQVGYWQPLGGSAAVPVTISGRFSGGVFFYGIGPSYEVYQTNRVRLAPIVELVGWRVVGGFETPGGRAGGTNIVNVKIGARVGWDDRSSVYVGFGHALTTASWYDDILRLEYRHSF